MNLNKLLTTESIRLNLENTDKDGVLKELIEMLYEQGAIDDKDHFLKDVYAREALGVTGIGNGIAIPHGKSDAVEKTGIVIGKSQDPIEWESLDDQPVHMVILFAVRNDERETMHVKLLSQVARVLGNDELAKKVFDSQSKDEILDVFIQNQ